MIRGIDRLTQEIEARENALARASSRAKEAIDRAATEMSRQWSLFSIMWKSMEKKTRDRREELTQQKQQLAVREAELAAEARNLELRRAELTREVEQRLAEVTVKFFM